MSYTHTTLGLVLSAVLAMTGCVIVDEDDENEGSTGGVTATGGSSSGGAAGAETGAAGESAGGSGGTAGSVNGGDAGAAQGGAATGGEGGTGGGAASDFVSVSGGTFVEGDEPTASTSSDRPVINGVTGIGSLINGGSGLIHVSFADAQGNDTVREAILVIEGDSGFSRVTLDTTSNPNLASGEIDLQVTMASDLEPGTVTFRFALVDAEGNISDYVAQEYDVVETGTGEVKVSLSFDQDSDVDLHVVEPGGIEIYYNMVLSESGGRLDLDSNASCSIDGVNNENVFWETNAPTGEYIVRVQYYNACSVTDPVNYVVTVHNGTAVNTYPGTLTPEQVGEPIEVVRFTR